VFGKSDSFKVSTFRRKALTLRLPVNRVQSAADHPRARHMQHLWLSHANDEDPLDRLPPVPPANSNAIVVTRQS